MSLGDVAASPSTSTLDVSSSRRIQAPRAPASPVRCANRAGPSTVHWIPSDTDVGMQKEERRKGAKLRKKKKRLLDVVMEANASESSRWGGVGNESTGMLDYHPDPDALGVNHTKVRKRNGSSVSLLLSTFKAKFSNMRERVVEGGMSLSSASLLSLPQTPQTSRGPYEGSVPSPLGKNASESTRTLPMSPRKLQKPRRARREAAFYLVVMTASTKREQNERMMVKEAIGVELTNINTKHLSEKQAQGLLSLWGMLTQI
ncbi:hypothetical protein CYLTODRAFT_410285 [Cylindrobasidium torrendii FP15055 ss-10]|uniref:Uncharacterized protein n=1 Tax=Cylindrobasidium torrendii FP15055 ss-10 TaxID=1314674 RepID=A0A0D7BEH3_9AGAR|nr:hypothetical protein CYLTODRAFT_410285 [Cylindrobasidium torrendii FP15055 ss-10]